VVIIDVRVILVYQRCSHTEVTQQYGTVVVDKQICCFDIPVDKSIDMQIAIGVEEMIERREIEKLA
jgi:predicted protein tyrosine phosphatase